MVSGLGARSANYRRRPDHHQIDKAFSVWRSGIMGALHERVLCFALIRTQGSQSKLANNFEQCFFDFFSFRGWCHKQESLSPSALISASPPSLHSSVV